MDNLELIKMETGHKGVNNQEDVDVGHGLSSFPYISTRAPLLIMTSIAQHLSSDGSTYNITKKQIVYFGLWVMLGFYLVTHILILVRAKSVRPAEQLRFQNFAWAPNSQYKFGKEKRTSPPPWGSFLVFF